MRPPCDREVVGRQRSSRCRVPPRRGEIALFGRLRLNALVLDFTDLCVKVSTFFLTQFLTSLLWVRTNSLNPHYNTERHGKQATVAAKHSQRLVLTISLLGSAVTCCLFGTSTSIQQAIAIRLLQGVFAGAIGVARGCVTSVTDQSNEGRAYAILG